MLSELQISKLNDLQKNCDNPVIRKIFDKVFPKWISGEIIPRQRSFGLDFNEDGYHARISNSCCLLGTFLIGEKCLDSQYGDSATQLNVSVSEIVKITDTFDGCGCESRIDYPMIFELRKILFGE